MLRFPSFCQLQKKPVNVYGVNAPLNDAVAELCQGKKRETLFLLAHSYVSLVSHLCRLLLGPFYRISAHASRMRSESAHPDVFLCRDAVLRGDGHPQFSFLHQRVDVKPEKGFLAGHAQDRHELPSAFRPVAKHENTLSVRLHQVRGYLLTACGGDSRQHFLVVAAEEIVDHVALRDQIPVIEEHSGNFPSPEDGAGGFLVDSAQHLRKLLDIDDLGKGGEKRLVIFSVLNNRLHS